LLGAVTRMDCKAFIAWVFALPAVERVTRRIRTALTLPDLSFGIAVAVPARTERAACSESSWSDLPCRRRAARSGRLTSKIVTPAALMTWVSSAPQLLVPSIPRRPEHRRMPPLQQRVVPAIRR
jgi:hypothetical protein